MGDNTEKIEYPQREKNEKNKSNVDLQSVTASNITLTGAEYDLQNSRNTISDDAYDPFSNRDTAHRTSDFGALIHIFKGSFGSGILAVPRAFRNSGYMFGLIGTALTGILCAHCVSILVKCSHVLSVREKKPSLGFEDTAEVAFSTGPIALKKYARLAKNFVTVSLFLTYYLGNTVYVVLIAEAFKQIFDVYIGTNISVRVYIALTSIVLVPLGIARRLKYLVPVSAFGVIFIMFGIVVTFYYAFVDFPPFSARQSFTSIEKLPLFFATIVFAMEGIGTVLPVENSMKNPDHFRGLTGVLSISMTLIVSLYITVGFICYLRYGEDTQTNITLNLPHDALSETVKLLVAFSILFTYPLQFCVPTEIMWSRIKIYVAVRHENTVYYVMRCIMILGTIMLGLVIPNLTPAIGLVGAICLATLGLFIPAVIETVTYWEEDIDNWRVVKNIIIMILSLMATISGTYTSVEDIIDKYTNSTKLEI